MSPRRAETVSPLIGCFSKADPTAVQSLRVPSSKSRLSGLPSLPTGRTPSGAAASTALLARSAARAAARSAGHLFLVPLILIKQSPHSGHSLKLLQSSAQDFRGRFQGQRRSRLQNIVGNDVRSF